MSSLIKFFPHVLCGVVLLLASLSHCGPGPATPHPPYATLATDVDMTVAGNDDDETTAAVVPPKRNPKCPDGRVIISSGSRLKKDPAAPQSQLPAEVRNFPSVLVRDLNGPGNLKEVALPAPTPLGDYNMVSSDSQLVRLANDNIVLIYAVAAKPPLTDPEALASFDQWKSFTFGWRSAFLIWRTSDCGDTWSQPWAVLDSAAIKTPHKTAEGTTEEVVGAYGWPQGNVISPWVGGYDMQWAYTDPWRPNSLYIASMARGGNATFLGNPPPDAFPGHFATGILLFASEDGGVTWNKPSVVLPNESMDYPVAMTSLPPNQHHPQGRLFAFRCIYGSGEPRLYWSDDQWKTLAGEAAVFFGSPNDPQTKCQEGLDPSKLPGGGLRYSGGVSLSRVKSDATRDWVRVAYSAFTPEGRQVVRIVLVELERRPGSPQDSVKTTPAFSYEAQNTGPGGNILYPTFIDPDHVELKDDDVNTAVLYWGETTPFGTVYMRYATVKGGGADSVGEWSQPRDLSVENGARRQWVMQGGDWFGDYFKGAFYMDGPEFKYLAQWAERRPGANRGVSYNIITLQP